MSIRKIRTESGRFGKGNPGKPKGAQSKTTKAAKEALELAFEGIGGVEALKTWATANPTDFYKLWAKLLPIQITGKDGKDLIQPPQPGLDWLGYPIATAGVHDKPV